MTDYTVRRVSRICEDIETIGDLHLRNGIESLNLHGNRLTTTLGLGAISTLTELDLSANSIVEIQCLDSLVCLRMLNLSNNTLSDIPPASLNSLVSLRHLNLSYNVVRSLSFLTAFANSQSQLIELLFHGNEVSNISMTIKMLQSVPSIRRISIADNPITEQHFTIFNAVKSIEGIDGVNRQGSPLQSLQFQETPVLPNFQEQTIASPRTVDNPWVSTTFDQQSNVSHIASKLVEMASAAKQVNLEEENRETRSKIDKIEKQLEQLIQLKNEKPKVKKTTIPKQHIVQKRQPCSQCANLMTEMKTMAFNFQEFKTQSNEELVRTRQDKFNTKKQIDDFNLDYVQKENQLKVALEAVIKFKELYLKERSKSESFENTMARAAKEITTEKRCSKTFRDEIELLKHKNEKLTNERDKLVKEMDKQNIQFSSQAERCSNMEREVLLLNQKLRTSIHPDSPEMQQLMRDKLHMAGKYMDEWKSDAKSKYSDLEAEFREALSIEDKEKKTLKMEIDQLKQDHSELRINQEKLYFSERKARETLELVTKQANEFRHKNDVAEDKVSRLVDAIRKSKDLADLRYKDEQRAKVQLNEVQKSKSKLISVLTEQEGILNGLKSEREKWSTDLATQTSQLAKERGALYAEVDALKAQLNAEMENRNKLRIKEKELESAHQSFKDGKEKLEIYRCENSSLRGELDTQEKCLTKMEAKLSNLEGEREQLIEEMMHFENEKKQMEKKWKDRTNVIEALEHKVTNISRTNHNKENQLSSTINVANRQIVNLQTDVDEKTRIISEKDTSIRKYRSLVEENQRLLHAVKFEKEKVVQVEEELRELLRERQDDKIQMQKKLELFTKTMLK